MQKGLALSIDRTSLPRVRTAARLVARILPLAGLAAALAACGLAQGSGGGGQVTVQAVEKTATVSGVTRSCVAWRSDAALVKQNGGPLSKTLPTEVKTLEEEVPGWGREGTPIRAIDKAGERRKAAVKAMDPGPKEPKPGHPAGRP